MTSEGTGMNNALIYKIITVAIILFSCVMANAKSPICFQGEFDPDLALMLAWGDTALSKKDAVWNLSAFLSTRPTKKEMLEHSLLEEYKLVVSRPDQVLKVTPDGTTIILLAITTPYGVGEGSFSCNACEPLLGAQLWLRQGTTWCLKAEDRAIASMGSMGAFTYLRVDVVKAGSERSGVLFEDDCGKGGYGSIRSVLLIPDGEGFNIAFDEVTAEDNIGMYGEHEKQSFQYNAKISFIPGQNAEYYNLRIVTSGTKMDDGNRRISWNREKIYVMEKGRYVLKTDLPVVMNKHLPK
jgi:hypothetical protein